MKSTIKLNNYKEKKIDEALEKSDEAYAEFQTNLARYSMKIDNGATVTENDMLALMEMMRKHHEAQVNTRKQIDKYKK